MTTTQTLPYVPFSDPYNLKGQERKEALNNLSRFTVEYQKMENPSQQDKRHFFDACLYLEKEALRYEQKIRLSIMTYRRMSQNLINTELELFKTTVKLKFLETYQKEISEKQFTAQMSKDLDKITKMEEKACYSVSGIDIRLKDCEVCGQCRKQAAAKAQAKQQELRVEDEDEDEKTIDEILDGEYGAYGGGLEEKTLEDIIKEEEGEDERLAE